MQLTDIRSWFISAQKEFFIVGLQYHGLLNKCYTYFDNKRRKYTLTGGE